jgi:hypothetical protein
MSERFLDDGPMPVQSLAMVLRRVDDNKALSGRKHDDGLQLAANSLDVSPQRSELAIVE